jgi:hypothetical protein
MRQQRSMWERRTYVITCLWALACAGSLGNRRRDLAAAADPSLLASSTYNCTALGCSNGVCDSLLAGPCLCWDGFYGDDCAKCTKCGEDQRCLVVAEKQKIVCEDDVPSSDVNGTIIWINDGDNADDDDADGRRAAAAMRLQALRALLILVTVLPFVLVIAFILHRRARGGPRAVLHEPKISFGNTVPYGLMLSPRSPADFAMRGRDNLRSLMEKAVEACYRHYPQVMDPDGSGGGGGGGGGSTSTDASFHDADTYSSSSSTGGGGGMRSASKFGMNSNSNSSYLQKQADSGINKNLDNSLVCDAFLRDAAGDMVAIGSQPLTDMLLSDLFRLEIPRPRMSLAGIMETGQFGVYFRGDVSQELTPTKCRSQQRPPTFPATIMMVNACEEEQVAVLTEILLSSFLTHDCIRSVVAVSLSHIPYYVVSVQEVVCE